MRGGKKGKGKKEVENIRRATVRFRGNWEKEIWKWIGRQEEWKRKGEKGDTKVDQNERILRSKGAGNGGQINVTKKRVYAGRRTNQEEGHI